MAFIGTDLARHPLRSPLGVDLANPSFAAEIRGLGAIAHFDPSVGATDDGTTSTWVDRIGGYSVASTSQATRMTYSTSVAGLNNRPGFVGVAASATRLVGAADLADRIDGSVAYTMYTVAISSDLTSANGIAGLGSTTISSCAYLRYGASSGETNYERRDAGASTLHVGLVRSGLNASVTSLVYTGAVASVYTNGSTATVAAANTRAGVCDRFVIGASLLAGAYSLSLDGAIGDIIIFLGAHTDAQRMYVERLIAAKYGWPVLQGLSGFTAANYLETIAGAGIRGSASGLWTEALIRPDAVPSGTHTIARCYAGVSGYSQYSSGNSHYLAGNGTITANAPFRTVAAADVGKLAIQAGTANLSTVQQFWNGAQVGGSTALTGYSTPAGTAKMSVGAQETTGASPASSFSIFGIAGGDIPQSAAQAAARAAAIKAAQRFVAHSGVAATHAWSLDSVKSSYAGLAGPDALTMIGTLTAAQIIIPTWPW